jgi:ribose-phosphate pyrophosphokinase
VNLEILSSSANPVLAENIAKLLGVKLAPRILERFPDGELHIEIQQSLRGADMYLIQPTCPPVMSTFLSCF